MSVSYSAIKAFSEPAAMAAFLDSQVIGPVLSSVRVARVRTRPGRRFEAPRVLWNVYEAELELPGGIEVRPLLWTKAFFDDGDCKEYAARIRPLLQGRAGNPLDPEGWARFYPERNLFLFFYPADPVFPALPNVSRADRVLTFLEPLARRQRPGLDLGAVSVTRIKYLPEISCILRYDVDLGEASPLSIYGKVQHSRRGQLTYDVMTALWALPARARGDLVLAEPLAYRPELDLLLQSAVPGVEVPGDRHSEVFMRQCEAAGRTIGHIHGSGITAGPAHTLAVEVERLHNRLEEFKMSSPAVYLGLRDLLLQITASARRLAVEAPVPSHGDYKYNQFLYDGARFGLIDVEYFVQAEPSFDLGKYCAHVWPSAPQDWSDTAQAALARKAFLDAYRALRPDYRGARLPVYEAVSLATRALVVTWAQSRNWDYTAQTLIALAYERLKSRWDE